MGQEFEGTQLLVPYLHVALAVSQWCSGGGWAAVRAMSCLAPHWRWLEGWVQLGLWNRMLMFGVSSIKSGDLNSFTQKLAFPRVVSIPKYLGQSCKISFDLALGVPGSPFFYILFIKGGDSVQPKFKKGISLHLLIYHNTSEPQPSLFVKLSPKNCEDSMDNVFKQLS